LKSIQIPSLAFGNRKAHVDTSEHAMQERLKLLANGIHIYDSQVKPGEFINQSFFTCINGLTIGSTAGTPIKVDLRQVNTPMLLIPIFGSGAYHMGGEDIDWRAGDKGALLPAEDFTGECSLRSSLAIFIDSDRLEKTIRSMLGIEDADAHLIELDRPQEVSLWLEDMSFSAAFRQLSEAIDLFSTRPGLLDLSGVDDQVYRTMAMMLKPNLFKFEVDRDVSMLPNRKLLDRVCQYIQENTHNPITLTDLERVSCISRRNLHYAFQHHFKCTPMQWVRTQRLETARSMLMKAGSSLSVTTTAFLCGFNKASTFAHDYRLRFGELPSETMMKSH
jgi:AraC-like DNA-binding protein